MTINEVAAGISNLSVHTEPCTTLTLPPLHNTIIDEQFCVSASHAKKFMAQLYQQSMANIYKVLDNNKLLINEAYTTVRALLQAILNMFEQTSDLAEVRMVGHELYKVLGIHFLEGALQQLFDSSQSIDVLLGSAETKRLQLACQSPLDTYSFRFTLSDHVSDAARKKIVQDIHACFSQSLGGKDLLPVFHHKTVPFSSFSFVIRSNTSKRITFTFTNTQTAYFATCDAVQLLLSQPFIQKTNLTPPSIIDNGIGTQWLVDTCFKILRVEREKIRELPPILLRYLMQGYIPVNGALDTLVCKDEDLASLWQWGEHTESACALLHVAKIFPEKHDFIRDTLTLIQNRDSLAFHALTCIVDSGSAHFTCATHMFSLVQMAYMGRGAVSACVELHFSKPKLVLQGALEPFSYAIAFDEEKMLSFFEQTDDCQFFNASTDRWLAAFLPDVAQGGSCLSLQSLSLQNPRLEEVAYKMLQNPQKKRIGAFVTLIALQARSNPLLLQLLLSNIASIIAECSELQRRCLYLCVKKHLGEIDETLFLHDQGLDAWMGYFFSHPVEHIHAIALQLIGKLDPELQKKYLPRLVETHPIEARALLVQLETHFEEEEMAALLKNRALLIAELLVQGSCNWQRLCAILDPACAQNMLRSISDPARKKALLQTLTKHVPVHNLGMPVIEAWAEIFGKCEQATAWADIDEDDFEDSADLFLRILEICTRIKSKQSQLSLQLIHCFTHCGSELLYKSCKEAVPHIVDPIVLQSCPEKLTQALDFAASREMFTDDNIVCMLHASNTRCQQIALRFLSTLSRPLQKRCTARVLEIDFAHGLDQVKRFLPEATSKEAALWIGACQTDNAQDRLTVCIVQSGQQLQTQIVQAFLPLFFRPQACDVASSWLEAAYTCFAEAPTNRERLSFCENFTANLNAFQQHNLATLCFHAIWIFQAKLGKPLQNMHIEKLIWACLTLFQKGESLTQEQAQWYLAQVATRKYAQRAKEQMDCFLFFCKKNPDLCTIKQEYVEYLFTHLHSEERRAVQTAVQALVQSPQTAHFANLLSVFVTDPLTKMRVLKEKKQWQELAQELIKSPNPAFQEYALSAIQALLKQKATPTLFSLLERYGATLDRLWIQTLTLCTENTLSTDVSGGVQAFLRAQTQMTEPVKKAIWLYILSNRACISGPIIVDIAKQKETLSMLFGQNFADAQAQNAVTQFITALIEHLQGHVDTRRVCMPIACDSLLMLASTPQRSKIAHSLFSLLPPDCSSESFASVSLCLSFAKAALIECVTAKPTQSKGSKNRREANKSVQLPQEAFSHYIAMAKRENPAKLVYFGKNVQMLLQLEHTPLTQLLVKELACIESAHVTACFMSILKEYIYVILSQKSISAAYQNELSMHFANFVKVATFEQQCELFTSLAVTQREIKHTFLFSTQKTEHSFDTLSQAYGNFLVACRAQNKPDIARKVLEADLSIRFWYLKSLTDRMRAPSDDAGALQFDLLFMQLFEYGWDDTSISFLPNLCQQMLSLQNSSHLEFTFCHSHYNPRSYQGHSSCVQNFDQTIDAICNDIEKKSLIAIPRFVTQETNSACFDFCLKLLNRCFSYIKTLSPSKNQKAILLDFASHTLRNFLEYLGQNAKQDEQLFNALNDYVFALDQRDELFQAHNSIAFSIVRYAYHKNKGLKNAHMLCSHLQKSQSDLELEDMSPLQAIEKKLQTLTSEKTSDDTAVTIFSLLYALFDWQERCCIRAYSERNRVLYEILKCVKQHTACLRPQHCKYLDALLFYNGHCFGHDSSDSIGETASTLYLQALLSMHACSFTQRAYKQSLLFLQSAVLHFKNCQKYFVFARNFKVFEERAKNFIYILATQCLLPLQAMGPCVKTFTETLKRELGTTDNREEKKALFQLWQDELLKSVGEGTDKADLKLLLFG